MQGTRKTQSLGLFLGLALVLGIAIAPSAAAAEGLVLTANGQPIPNGALVNIATVENPEYSFKTEITVAGTTAPVEEEIECEDYLEQGTIEHNEATGTWSVVETHPVEICEGTWLEEGLVQNHLTFSSTGSATDESSLELFRSGEEIRAEEREQAERGEPVHAREPLGCEYTTTATGSISHSTKKPLLAKFKGKATMHPIVGGIGCGVKAKWKGGFTMTYQGQPVFAKFEAA